MSGPVVIDEIQRLPELFPANKLALDGHLKPGRFLLTGASNVLRAPRRSDSRVGRKLVNVVGGGLRKQVSRAAPQVTLHRFRTVTGSQGEVLPERPAGTVAGIEVEAGRTAIKAHLPP